MEEKITKEAKERYTVWMMPSTREEVEELMQNGNCKRISEFIEKAVNFYCGYLRSSTQDYVPQIVLTTLKSLIILNSTAILNREPLCRFSFSFIKDLSVVNTICGT